MYIIHLTYAIEVEKTASMTKAADNLYLGQPTLSRGIKELEASLGIKIFKRTATGIRPTARGEEFLSHAKEIVAQINEVEALFNPEKSNKIVFNISAPRADYICNAFVKTVAALDQSKEIDINYRETNAVRAIDNINQGNYSLGIIKFQEEFMPYFETMLESKGLKHELVVAYEAKLVVAKNSALGKQAVVDVATLQDSIEVCYGDPFVPSLPSAAVKKAEFTQPSNKRIMVYERSSIWQLLAEVPKTYTWTSGMPSAVKHPDAFQFARLEGIAPKKYVHLLIWKKNHTFTPHEQLFLKHLKQCKQEKFDRVGG